MGFSTDAIHAGQSPDPTTGAIVVPIYQTSTFVQQGLGEHRGYEYARSRNPTRSALESNIAALELGSHGIAFSSGMAAINALLSLFEKGDHIVVSDAIYGGTYRLFEKLLGRFGLSFSWINTSQPSNVEEALREETKLVFLETPTNPLMTLSDIELISQICHRRDVLVSVDNTFMSPYLQRPLELGADFAIHSTTKFLNGHSDSVGGVLVVKDPVLADKLYFIQKAAGAILGPFDCWLVLRGIKTLAVRMREHEKNGRQVATFLSSDPRVSQVHYPGLESHPQHQLAMKQQHGFGSMISFQPKDCDNAPEIVKKVCLCSLAESLGGVETLISHPATMSHAALPRQQRERLGITEDLIRISVGIEDVEDIIADLDQAL
ncbi:MAG: PLP-dependent aspartate aminotransferase family protein [Acidobacteriota bacterium]